MNVWFEADSTNCFLDSPPYTVRNADGTTYTDSNLYFDATNKHHLKIKTD